MSDQEQIQPNKPVFKLVTGVSRTAVGAVAVALLIVTLVLLAGSLFAVWSGISSSVGGPSPNTWIKNTPLNARSYTGTENPWYAALIAMGMAVAAGVGTAVLGTVFKDTPTTFEELRGQVQSVSTEAASTLGFK